MRALITGGAGFIGSHLADTLLGAGHEVVVFDDLSTGREVNVAHLSDDPRFVMHIGSVEDADALDPWVARSDVVFHLAAAVGVQLIVESPVRTIETNVHGTEVVLDRAAAHGKKVLLASSSEVYGKSSEVPFREDQDLVLGPTHKGRWSYACSKALDEFLALAYGRERSLPVVIMRLFNTVGPRQTGRYGMVVPSLARQALAGKPVTVYGDGEQSRTFVHVLDVTEAMLALSSCEGAIGEVVNLGGDEEVTIHSLAQRIVGAAGSTSAITHVPYAEAYREGFEDLRRRVPDTAKAGRLIGFSPTRSLDTIIEDVLRFERSAPS